MLIFLIGVVIVTILWDSMTKRHPSYHDKFFEPFIGPVMIIVALLIVIIGYWTRESDLPFIIYAIAIGISGSVTTYKHHNHIKPLSTPTKPSKIEVILSIVFGVILIITLNHLSLSQATRIMIIFIVTPIWLYSVRALRRYRDQKRKNHV